MWCYVSPVYVKGKYKLSLSVLFLGKKTAKLIFST